jgi:hypothetical protein
LALKDSQEAWRTNTDEGCWYYEGKKATVLYRPDEVFPDNWYDEALKNDTLQALDKRFRELRGDLTADIIDILNLHWFAHQRPPKARITLSQICRIRGVKPERKALEQHWRAVRDARAIRLRGLLIEDIALLELDAIRPPQPNLFGLQEPPSADLVIIYSPGACIGYAMSSTPFYIASYTPRFLTLDPQKYYTAKRLARYLRGEWRMNPEGYVGGQPMRYRRWRDHLADAGIDPLQQFTGRRRHSEFLDSLDLQLLKLTEVGALGKWTPRLHRSDELWGDWDLLASLYHPQDRACLDELPYHGRLEAFLALRVHLPPPDDLRENLERYARQRAARAAQQQARAHEVEVRRALGGRCKP